MSVANHENMNQRDSSVHQITGLPQVLVDGFRHRHPDTVPCTDRTFVLSHFHSDHYSGLTERFSEGNIICTTITSSFIQHVIGVASEFVTPLAYNKPHAIPGGAGATIEFLDANHCPGAALMLFTLKTGERILHCGDMRYHPKMKLYPALQPARGKINTIYLDTTYAHPRHAFCNQSESIDTIVTEARDFLSKNPGGVVLLSAYNIGKERVIDAVSEGCSSAPVYMNPDKLRLVQHLLEPAEFKSRLASGLYTSDPHRARVHVCGMGQAAQMWPFFQPNWGSLQTLREELNSPQGFSTASAFGPSHSHESEGEGETEENGAASPPPFCTHLLCFIPTGWATCSNFNRKHAHTTDPSDPTTSIRLVPYSEHSTCPELVEFVQFLKPMRVVPTVYRDQKEYERIEALFERHVDHTQNKRAFLGLLGGTSAPKKAREENSVDDKTAEKAPEATKPSLEQQQQSESGDEVVFVASSASSSSTSISTSSSSGGWSCSACTFRHTASAKQCAMCGTSSGQRPIPGTSAAASRPIQSFFSPPSK